MNDFKKNESLFHGALIIDKPSGITSHDVVGNVRKIFNTKAVGHAGTLDPIATGLLICLLGEATKLSQYVMSEKKAYRVGVKLGIRTDSGDISGKVIEEKPIHEFSETTLNEKIGLLVGEIQLPVPKYSAVKIDGKKLYEYARENIDIEVPIKAMHIHTAQVVEFGQNRILIDMDCEKGTYVRSWVEKLGELLGCGATVESLRRTKSGPFEISQSFDLADLKKLPPDDLKTKLIPLAEVLGAWPALKVEGQALALIKNGQIPRGIYSQILNSKFRDGGVRLLTSANELLALVVSDPSKGLKLARVFNGA